MPRLEKSDPEKFLRAVVFAASENQFLDTWGAKLHHVVRRLYESGHFVERGENRGRFIDIVTKRPQEILGGMSPKTPGRMWCASLPLWILEAMGAPMPSATRPGSAWRYWEARKAANWWRSCLRDGNHFGRALGNLAKPGDLIFVGRKGKVRHVGIVDRVPIVRDDRLYVPTLEGNLGDKLAAYGRYLADPDVIGLGRVMGAP